MPSQVYDGAAACISGAWLLLRINAFRKTRRTSGSCSLEHDSLTSQALPTASPFTTWCLKIVDTTSASCWLASTDVESASRSEFRKRNGVFSAWLHLEPVGDFSISSVYAWHLAWQTSFWNHPSQLACPSVLFPKSCLTQRVASRSWCVANLRLNII